MHTWRLANDLLPFDIFSWVFLGEAKLLFGSETGVTRPSGVRDRPSTGVLTSSSARWTKQENGTAFNQRRTKGRNLLQICPEITEMDTALLNIKAPTFQSEVTKAFRAKTCSRTILAARIV